MRRPQRAIITHWFNPPHIVPIVEVVPGPREVSIWELFRARTGRGG